MKKLALLLSIAIAVMLSACNEKMSEGNGRLAVKITDAPFPIDLIENASVTITKIEIRKTGESEGRPFIVVSEDTMTLNLINLRNGVVEALPEITLPAGEYDLVRLYVEEASLKVKEGGSYNVKVPSGEQTGIKIFINPGLKVEGGLTSELLLDFDLSGSFVVQGNPMTPAGINGFHFKPVIRAVNISTAGRIEGMVADTLKVPVKNPVVWIKQDTIVATAIGDTLGRYAFLGVKAGSYTVYATKVGYDTAEYKNVNVIPANKTVRNIVLIKK